VRLPRLRLSLASATAGIVVLALVAWWVTDQPRDLARCLTGEEREY
jgi:hypothetical protein